MHENLLAILTALQRLKLELCEEILHGRQQFSMMSMGTKQRRFHWEIANVFCSFVYSSAAPRIGWLSRRSTFGPHIYTNPYSAIPASVHVISYRLSLCFREVEVISVPGRGNLTMAGLLFQMRGKDANLLASPYLNVTQHLVDQDYRLLSILFPEPETRKQRNGA